MEESTSSKVGNFVSSAVTRIINLVMILVIIALVGLVAWFWHNNQLLEQKVEGLEDEVEKMEKMSLGSGDKDVVVEEDVEYIRKSDVSGGEGISEASEGDQVDKTFAIEEFNWNIKLPIGYSLIKRSDKNRRGSFVSYDFSDRSLDSSATLNEIQFFTENSIREFIDKCGDELCFMGDYPDTERYNGQKKSFYADKDYLNYKLRKIGDRYYFVSDRVNVHDRSSITREYTTFIGDVKIDIWVSVENESLKLLKPEEITDLMMSGADELLKKVEIIE